MTGTIALASLPVFKGIHADFAKRLEACSLTMTKNKSEVILVEGDEVLGLYIIVQGAVHVHSYRSKKAISRLVGGDIFGEMSLVEGQKASATIRAAVDGTSLVLIHGGKFKQLLATDPEGAAFFYQRISTLLSKRLRDTTHRLFEYIDSLDDHLIRCRDLLKQLPSIPGQKEQLTHVQTMMAEVFGLAERLGQSGGSMDAQRAVVLADTRAQVKTQQDHWQTLQRKLGDALSQWEKVATGISLQLEQMHSKTPELKGFQE